MYNNGISIEDAKVAQLKLTRPLKPVCRSFVNFISFQIYSDFRIRQELAIVACLGLRVCMFLSVTLHCLSPAYIVPYQVS